jgi:hypothetical protein
VAGTTRFSTSILGDALLSVRGVARLSAGDFLFG